LLDLAMQPLPDPDPPGHEVFGPYEAKIAIEVAAMEAAVASADREALGEVMRTAAAHPARVVRRAAIDVFLARHGDSAEAKKQLRALIAPEDAKLLELVRVHRGSSLEQVDAELSAYYEAHPEDRADPAGVRIQPPKENEE
jgi:hypothetical protein